VRESVDSLRSSGGVCGERLGGVEAELGECDCDCVRGAEMEEVLMLDSGGNLAAWWFVDV